MTDDIAPLVSVTFQFLIVSRFLFNLLKNGVVFSVEFWSLFKLVAIVTCP